METVEFKVFCDFEQPLADRFATFINSLTSPCAIRLDIESHGGYTEVLQEMEALIAQKKQEGFVFITNVENYAFSCGMFLFLLGDVRLASESANFLFHASGFDVFDRLTSGDLREMLEVLEEADAFTARILAENTTVAPGIQDILNKNDNFLNREDLIFLGFMEAEYEQI